MNSNKRFLRSDALRYGLAWVLFFLSALALSPVRAQNTDWPNEYKKHVRANERGSSTGEVPLYSASEMAAIQFKPGLPLTGGTLESALQDSDFYLKSLQRDIGIIKRYPQMKFEIIGFTDAAECRAAQCESLSADRARAVHDWLRSKGVPATSLIGPYGRGNAMPLDIGDTEEGRAKNRRVEINLSPD